MLKPINGPTWRQYMKMEDVDFCGFLSGNDVLIDVMRAVREIYLHKFPNFPSKCPVEKGKYFSKNTPAFSVDNSTNRNKVDQKLTPSHMPNGIYRHTVRLYNKIDPEGAMFYWHTKIYDSMGDDRL
jgi:hypothetical protein